LSTNILYWRIDFLIKKLIMKIAFWNLNKKNLSELLVGLVNSQEIDILLLAEVNESVVLDFIVKQRYINKSRSFNHISDSRVNVLSTFNPAIFSDQKDLIRSTRWGSFHINIPSIFSFNLFPVHFPSKVNWSDNSLALECVNLSRDIEDVEIETKEGNTIVMGDFNMNPFENGFVAANGLHALQDLEHVAGKPSGRIIDGVNYRYFYNPMWNFFGDHKKPLGTHYYRESGHVSQEWNIYDQVIYRPSLGQHIQEDSVEILHSVNGEDLINALNRPDKANYSDHLPIVLKINI